MPSLIYVLISIGIVFFAPQSFAVKNPIFKCFKVITAQSSAKSSGQTIFDNIVEPTFSLRIFDKNIDVSKDEQSVTIGSIELSNGKIFPEYEFRVSEDQKIVSVENIKNENIVIKVVITLPNADRLERGDANQNIILNLFNRHPLHPYISNEYLSKPYFEAKLPQEEGAEALRLALEKGHTDFTFIASTGVGKSYVIYKGIEHMLKYLKPGLLIVTAHQVNIVNQLRQGLYNNQAVKKAFSADESVIHWSRKSPPDFKKIIATTERRAARGEFTILVTPIRSLTLQALPGATLSKGEGLSEAQQIKNLNMLAQIVRSLIFDEAHHAGAPDAKEFIEYLDQVSNEVQGVSSFLLNTTATPFHHTVDLIKSLFNGRLFMAMFDTAKSYFLKPKVIAEDRFVEQLVKAMELSYIRHISSLFVLIPGSNGVPEDLLIQNNDSGKRGSIYELNENYLPWLFKKIDKTLKNHEYGFFAVPSIADTEVVSKYFKENYPNLKVKTYHSGISKVEQEEIIESFRNQEFNFLITKGMLDEGIDLPFMTLYVDFNRSIGPRQILQRLGRTLRLFVGKGDVEVVALFDISAENIMQEIGRLADLLDKRLFSLHGNSNNENSELTDPLDYEVGIRFNRDNMRTATGKLVDAINAGNIESNRSIFFDFKTDKLSIIKEKTSKFNREEAWNLVRSWYEKYNFLPVAASQGNATERDKTTKAKFIRNLIRNLGGIKVARAVIIDKKTEAEALEEQAVPKSKKRGWSRANTPHIKSKAMIKWLETNHRWPDIKSTDPIESSYGASIKNQYGGAEQFLENFKVDSPLVRHGAKGQRLNLLVEYLRFQETYLGDKDLVSYPVSLNKPRKNEDDDRNVIMHKLGDLLFKSLSRVDANEIIQHLIQNEIYFKYPLIHFRYDKEGYYIVWRQKTKRLPSSSFIKKTVPSPTQKIESMLYKWLDKLDPKEQDKLNNFLETKKSETTKMKLEDVDDL